MSTSCVFSGCSVRPAFVVHTRSLSKAAWAFIYTPQTRHVSGRIVFVCEWSIRLTKKRRGFPSVFALIIPQDCLCDGLPIQLPFRCQVCEQKFH